MAAERRDICVHFFPFPIDPLRLDGVRSIRLFEAAVEFRNGHPGSGGGVRGHRNSLGPFRDGSEDHTLGNRTRSQRGMADPVAWYDANAETTGTTHVRWTRMAVRCRARSTRHLERRGDGSEAGRRASTARTEPGHHVGRDGPGAVVVSGRRPRPGLRDARSTAPRSVAHRATAPEAEVVVPFPVDPPLPGVARAERVAPAATAAQLALPGDSGSRAAGPSIRVRRHFQIGHALPPRVLHQWYRPFSPRP